MAFGRGHSEDRLAFSGLEMNAQCIEEKPQLDLFFEIGQINSPFWTPKNFLSSNHMCRPFAFSPGVEPGKLFSPFGGPKLP